MSFYLKKNMSQKHVCPCKVLEKSIPQTIDSSSKNDMYIMDFPTAHRFAAQEDDRGISYHFDPVYIIKLIKIKNKNSKESKKILKK